MLLSPHMLALHFEFRVVFLMNYLVRVTPYMPTRNISHNVRVSISGDLPGGESVGVDGGDGELGFFGLGSHHL